MTTKPEMLAGTNLERDFFDPERTLICDTECYGNFWSIGFRRVSDAKTVVFEHSVRKPMADEQRARIASLMRNNTIVGYNFIAYDAPMIALLISGATNAQLKQANDRIIVGGMKPWHAKEVLGVEVPRNWRIIDLIEPQPNAFASLKTLAGRMHAPKMQDLPYPPDALLTPTQMDEVLSYMGNDLHVTHLLFDALYEPLSIRAALTAEHDINLMSKSDSQVGETIVKRRVERITGERILKTETPPGVSFKYPVPKYLKYSNSDLRDILDRLRATDFIVREDGKVDLPEWLSDKVVTIGDTTYAMGIGGLHSTEKNRAICSDEDHVLIDADCASYYPAIILNSGLYPKSLGPHFLSEYRKIRDGRVAAKRAGDKVKAEGAKIQINGQFGKLGSKYSVLYAPHLMIAVTLTGQLALLMLIERAETAGIQIVSGNTDGIIFRCPRDREDEMRAICAEWERDTEFELEYTRYDAVYSASVNSYIAVKEGGSAKIKGPLGNPWRAGDLRGQLMKNPQATICSDAVVDFITKGVPIEETIRASTDVREFVTVVKVTGGGTWRGEYLGKVVRFYWSTDGEEILRSKAHAVTGNFAKVSKTDGCRPLMDLPDSFPTDIDYQAYIDAAKEMLFDYGYNDRPEPVKPVRVFKHSAIAWFALAA